MLKGLVGFLGLAFLTGCGAMSFRQPVTGFLYSDIHDTVTATSNQAGSRSGEACSQSILGLVATGDSSVDAARRNGGITMISVVDNYSQSYVGVYTKYCTVVHGR